MARKSMQEDKAPPKHPRTAAEAVRLRGEGLSLRAIASTIGADEKQVRRWLKAAGAEKPERIEGLDGRSYNTRCDTFADAPFPGWTDFHSPNLTIRDLRAITRAIDRGWMASNAAAEAGQDEEGCRRARDVAIYQELRESGLHDDPQECTPDNCDNGLEMLLVDLSALLTPEGLELLIDDLKELQDRQRRRSTVRTEEVSGTADRAD
jgi:hypothetical protein